MPDNFFIFTQAIIVGGSVNGDALQLLKIVLILRDNFFKDGIGLICYRMHFL